MSDYPDTQDLRSSAQDAKRQAQKSDRPRKGVGPNYRPLCRNNNAKRIYQENLARKKDRLHNPYDIPMTSADNSSLDQPLTQSAEVDIKYSFDAAHGPSSGNDVLVQALAKAVEKYDNSVIEKLVRDEYDVLDPSVEELEAKVTHAIDEEDRDFEFV